MQRTSVTYCSWCSTDCHDLVSVARELLSLEGLRRTRSTTGLTTQTYIEHLAARCRKELGLHTALVRGLVVTRLTGTTLQVANDAGQDRDDRKRGMKEANRAAKAAGRDRATQVVEPPRMRGTWRERRCTDGFPPLGQGTEAQRDAAGGFAAQALIPCCVALSASPSSSLKHYVAHIKAAPLVLPFSCLVTVAD